MYQIKSKNIKNNVSEFTKMGALIQLNKSVENGHLIRQSMKLRYGDIRRWTKQKRRWLTEEQKKELGLREWHNPAFQLSASDFNIKTGQQLDEFISKRIPEPNELNEDFKIVWIRRQLFNWIETVYYPTVFMTIQLPNHRKTSNKEIAKEPIRLAMSHFERELLGRNWSKYHLRFLCFMEKGKNGSWHAHILFNQGKFKPWHLWLATENTVRKLKWSNYCMHLDIMNADKTRVISYCFKEIKINNEGHFDSTRLIFSEELFGLNHSTAMG